MMTLLTKQKGAVMKLGLLLLAVTLSGCAGLHKQDIGVATGGILGGVLGHQIGGGTGKLVATIGGTILGSMIGGSIGQSMDKIDRMNMSQALERAPTEQATSWANPDSGNRYTVTPTNTYRSQGKPCREYVMTAIIGGKAEKIRGRACRKGSGDWIVL